MISALTTVGDWLSVIKDGRCRCRSIVNRRRQLTLLVLVLIDLPVPSGRLLPLAAAIWPPGRRRVHVAAVHG